jgi:replicative DNA helicase Mcm
MHYWGDKDFDWDGLDKAINYIDKEFRKWRIPVRQSKEKYGCYDDKTRILTKIGWKYFKDININDDLFATLNPLGYLEYHKAIDYIKQEYKGEMYYINTRGVNLLVTPNHNLYIAKADINGGKNNCYHKKYPYKLQSYKNLFRKDKNFLKGAKWKGINKKYFILPKYENKWNNVPNKTNNICRSYILDELKLNIIPWLSFLGWYVAEGLVTKNCQISLCIHKKEINKLSKIIKNCGFKHSISNRNNNSAVINIYHSGLASWLVSNCKHLSENRKVPDFVKSLSPNLIKIFLDSLYEGDGCQTKTALTLYTVSKILADDVLELLLKAGYCGRIEKRNRKNEISGYINGRKIRHNFEELSIRWLKKLEHRSSNSHDTECIKNKKEKLIQYNGKIYCVTVPNNIIYIERKGKPVWCGNSVRIYCSLGWTCLHDITHPGYVRYHYPKWLIYLDIYYLSKIVRLLNFIVVPIHKLVYKLTYKKAVDMFPHLKKEICCCADFIELLDFYK